ncbi:hypothetical protein SOPP22_17540 [Shewanella sp. OPT22]|nr:hypothetical protein SOPP22_17540 [Shewanella sp. OPT22]
MLNRVWFFFFLISFIFIGYQALSGRADVLNLAVDGVFKSAKTSAEIAVGLIGVMTLWMGLMRLGEKAGLIAYLSKISQPLLSKLMPEVPKNHPAFGSVTVALTANMLSLYNASTPMGIKAMQDLQSLNSNKEVASNAQIVFLALKCSSLSIVPVNVFLLRAQFGAEAPADIFIPILLASFCSTIVALFCVAVAQKLSIVNGVMLIYIGTLLTVFLGVIVYLLTLSAHQLGTFSGMAGNGALLLLIFSFVLIAGFKKVSVYDEFVEGAKEGFHQSIKLIPYLVAMLMAIGLLRSSGVLEYFISIIADLASFFTSDLRFIDALPTAMMKFFSGSGAKALMIESMQHYGVDSFSGRLAAIFNECTETTFYILAVYLGAVGIKEGRHVLACSLIGNVAGIIAAIFVCYWFYGTVLEKNGFY